MRARSRIVKSNRCASSRKSFGGAPVLRTGHLDPDRSLGGPLDFLGHAPGMLAACANRAVVTATRPPALAAISLLSILIVSVTGLAPEMSAQQPRTINVTLSGATPTVLNVDADTLFHTVASDFFLQDDGEMYVAVAGKDLASVADEIGTVTEANAQLAEYHRGRRASLSTE